MAFLWITAIISCVIQLAVLHRTAAGRRTLRYFSLLLMEGLPLGGGLFFSWNRPNVPYLGWEFRAASCLWAAGAVLAGYLLAWGIYAAGRKR